MLSHQPDCLWNQHQLIGMDRLIGTDRYLHWKSLLLVNL